MKWQAFRTLFQVQQGNVNMYSSEKICILAASVIVTWKKGLYGKTKERVKYEGQLSDY